MEAVEFLNEGTRMCHSYESCVGCPMYDIDDCCMVSVNLKQMISIVEKWAKEHPAKTRQSEFLKQCPEAEMFEDGYLNICPALISKEYRDKETEGCYNVKLDCNVCRHDFWLKEI